MLNMPSFCGSRTAKDQGAEMGARVMPKDWHTMFNTEPEILWPFQQQTYTFQSTIHISPYSLISWA